MKKSSKSDVLEAFEHMDNYTLQFEIERRTESVARERIALYNNLLFIKEAKKELLKRERK